MSDQSKPNGVELWEGSSVFVRQGRHWSSALIWLTAVLFGSSLLWAFLARIDQTVSVRGRLQPSGSVQEVLSSSTGLVSEVFVEEGDSVSIGDPLIRIEAKGLLSNRSATAFTLDLLRLERQSLQTIINSGGDPDQFEELPSLPIVNDSSLNSQLLAARNQTLQIRAQLQQLSIRIDSSVQSLRLQEQIVSELKPLYDGGGIARNSYLQQVNSIQVLRAALASLQGERSRFIGTTSSQLNQINRQILDLQTKLVSLKEQISYRTIKSPITGSIFDLNTSPRSLVSTSEVLLKIVPLRKLQAHVEISNADIGFVRPGQSVSVSIDSFPAGEFGYMSGQLTSIGSDSLPPDIDSPQVYFPATVTLDQQAVLSGSQELNLQSGMSVTANIKLRTRPAISIITDIFTRQLDGIKRFR